MKAKDGIHLLAGSEKSTHQQHAERNLLLPELAVDVRYPPGILSVKRQPLHLILEP